MSNRNTVVRVLHDVGAAAWFGGTLMGAVGLNGAASTVKDSNERAAVASQGWARWAPLNAAAIGAHAVGGAGLLIANRERAANQEGTRGNTLVKLGLTVVAVGLTVWSGVLGGTVAKAGMVPAEGAVVPSSDTPQATAAAMRQLRVVQFAIPAVVGVLIGLGAQQGEQQKGGEVAKGLAARARARVSG